MIALVICLWLLALAGCVALMIVSVRLFLRGFQQAFPRFGPPTTPPVVVPTRPSAQLTDAPAGTGHAVPGWTVKLVSDHLLGGCVPCRSAIETYRAENGIPTVPLADLLASLEPQTVTRIVALVEAHDNPPVVAQP